MISVKKMKEELNKFPEDAMCYAYEGEITGVVVVDKDREEVGYIHASEGFCHEKVTIVHE